MGGAHSHYRATKLPANLGGITPTSTPGIAALAADAFADSMGVVTHLDSSTYSNTAAVRSALQQLGIRHIRTKIAANNTQLRTILPQLQTDGIRVNCPVVTQPSSAKLPNNSLAQLKTIALNAINEAVAQYPGIIETIEGPNEPNISATGGYTVAAGDARNWWDDSIALQQYIYQQVKSSALPKKQVVCTTPGAKKDWTRFGDLSAYADFGNVHHYPGGHVPDYHYNDGGADVLTSVKAICGNLSVFCTETGTHDLQANSANSGHPWTPDPIAQYYAPRAYLDGFYNGVKRTFLYELYDEGTSTSDMEDHFGHFDNSWTPKATVAPIQRLFSVFADPGTSFTPQPLNYQLTGMPDDGRQMLFQKSNRHWLLAVWRTASLWTAGYNNAYPANALTVANATPTLTFSTPRTINTYRPSSAAGISNTVTGQTTRTLNLSNEVLILEIF